MDDNKKEVVNLNRASFSSSSDTYLLEKARKLLRGNNRESSPSSSINSPSWKAQPTLKAQSRFSTENGLQGQPQPRPPASGEAKSSIAVNGSPRIDDVNEHSNYQDVIVGSKKRKTQPTWTWTEHVRLSPGNALEGPPDDGYSWRKYGQKEILGSKYPRSYYACTYRQISDCRARKQVQRSNNDPTVLEILYTGAHTCNHQESSGSASPSPSPPPEKQELKDSIDAVDQYLDFPSDKQEALKKRRRTR